jgi:hypothetical protein
MSCHEREALTLHHENDPVPRGTIAGQFYTVVVFSNTSVVIFKAALLLPSLYSGEGHKAKSQGVTRGIVFSLASYPPPSLAASPAGPLLSLIQWG